MGSGGLQAPATLLEVGMADSNLAGHLSADDPHDQYTQKDLLPNQGDLMVGLGNGVVGVQHVDQAGFILFSIPNSPYGTGLQWLPIEPIIQRYIGSILRWEPLTNGDPLYPELVFADGDVIMVQVTD